MDITEIVIGKSRYHEVNDMIIWCYENFGNGGYLAQPEDRWILAQAFGNSHFQFRNAQDASVFALRWM